MTNTPYFTRKTFQFLKDLAANNRRDWFAENKARYEDGVKLPALRFIQDFQDRLGRLSPHFHAGPRSLFRIHRDTRFAKDKSPYKRHTGIHFRHELAGDVHAPGYYVHIEPGACFLGLGIWHPDGPSVRKIREAMVEDPAAWKKASRGKRFTATWEMSGDRLVRGPRGFDPEHPLAEDLKWKDFVAGRSVPQSFMTSPDLPDTLAKAFAAGSPFMAFLCRAVEVPF